MGDPEFPKVTLISQDEQNKGKDIPVSDGNTTIGRGPAFHITDKRVSRSHALIDVRGDAVEIMPVHANPTFFKGTKDKKFTILQRDLWKTLKNGDQIALLPDSLKFEVRIYEEKCDNVNVNITENKCEAAVKNLDTEQEADTSDLSRSLSAKNEKGDEAGPIEAKTLKHDDSTAIENRNISAELEQKETKVLQPDLLESSNTTSVSSLGFETRQPFDSEKPSGSEKTDLLTKKRSLPAWIISSANNVEEVKSPKKLKKKVGTNKSTCAAEEPLNVPEIKGNNENQTKNPIIESSTADKMDSYIEQNPVSKQSNVQPKPKKSTNITTSLEQKENDQLLLITKDPNNSKYVLTPVNQQTGAALHSSTITQGTDTGKNLQGESNHSKTTELKKDQGNEIMTSALPACPYGSRCYRKNPGHFLEYSHDVSQSSENDALPECPFGNRCYRKNPQHFLEYNHSAPQDSDDEPVNRRSRPSRGRRRAQFDESDDDGEPNTYDYNDSFIDDSNNSSFSDDDDYEDDEDDSDFKPSSEEDVRELVSEAMGFVGNKKFHKK